MKGGHTTLGVCPPLEQNPEGGHATIHYRCLPPHPPWVKSWNKLNSVYTHALPAVTVLNTTIVITTVF